MMYQLQASSPGHPGWYPATVNPIGWPQLLRMVKLWRQANPDCRLQAVRWEEAIR